MAQQHDSVDLVGDETVEYFAKAVLLAALTAALAQISIPLPGGLVPFSLQPFGAFFAGLLLGPLWGGLALTLYLLVGIAGAPVFSNGAAGLGYFFGGTGGFLVGFVFGAVVAGAIAHRGLEPRPLDQIAVATQLVGLLAAMVIIYAVGVPWLSWVTEIGLRGAATFMAPYAVLDLLKVAIAVAIVRGGYLVRE